MLDGRELSRHARAIFEHLPALGGWKATDELSGLLPPVALEAIEEFSQPVGDFLCALFPSGDLSRMDSDHPCQFGTG